MITVIAGNTIKLRCEFKTWENVYADPTNIVVNIYSQSKNKKIETINISPENKVSVGVYEIVYTVPINNSNIPNTPSEMIYEFVGLLEGTQTLGQGKFKRIVNI